MKIILCAEDIVRRCLWDNYVYYILAGSDKEAERLLATNEEMEISEKDALVIGLLKVIDTDNLIHKFNNHVVEHLTNKSIKHSDYLLARKKTFDVAVDKFLDKFPDYWQPKSRYVNALSELVEYIENMKKELENLEVHKVVDKNVTYEFYNSANIRKLLKFNY
jgi:hypothetical protein